VAAGKGKGEKGGARGGVGRTRGGEGRHTGRQRITHQVFVFLSFFLGVEKCKCITCALVITS
jgi:hypothetical protein